MPFSSKLQDEVGRMAELLRGYLFFYGYRFYLSDSGNGSQWHRYCGAWCGGEFFFFFFKVRKERTEKEGSRKDEILGGLDHVRTLPI